MKNNTHKVNDQEVIQIIRSNKSKKKMSYRMNNKEAKSNKKSKDHK